jgi:hypothetical protein
MVTTTSSSKLLIMAAPLNAEMIAELYATLFLRLGSGVRMTIDS